MSPAITLPELATALVASLVCRELIDGCPDCELEAGYKASVGHECGSDTEQWATLCTVMGNLRRESETFHRGSHEPLTCEGCGTKLRDNIGFDATVVKPCRVGWCQRWCCPACGKEWASNGPVTCPVCGGYRDPALSRIRSAYRRRRRYW